MFFIFFMSCIPYHIITCISFCIRVRFMHLSIFPVVCFAIRHSHMHRRTPLVFFHCAGVERSRNGLSLAKWPWYSTGRPPVKFRDVWSSFVLKRLTALPQRPLLSCSPTPLQNGPITHLNYLHVLRCRITVMWAKITPHLDTPNSLYLYICAPRPKIAF